MAIPRYRFVRLPSSRNAARGALGLILAAMLSGCCSENDYDIAVERSEGSTRSCASVCRAYLDQAEVEDVEYELRGCEDDVSEDGRDLAVCHVTNIDCTSNNHF